VVCQKYLTFSHVETVVGSHTLLGCVLSGVRIIERCAGSHLQGGRRSVRFTQILGAGRKCLGEGLRKRDLETFAETKETNQEKTEHQTSKENQLEERVLGFS
jgi:hypothetical protein